MFDAVVLLVEDDPDVARAVKGALSDAGYAVRTAGSLGEARPLLADATLVVLDRTLPDGDGLELLRELRTAQRGCGVIVLTARDAVEERVAGLAAGADDYLAKPFHTAELLARIAAILRRSQGQPPPTVVGDLRFEPARGTFYRGGTELELTSQEHRLLRFLLANAGRVVSRPEILEDVWHVHHDPGTNVVDVYVRYLRRKVDDPFGRPLIHTVRGLGYVLEDKGDEP